MEIHHLEMCVSDGKKTLEKMKSFGFTLFAIRITECCKQFVIKCGRVKLVITERISIKDPKNEDWTIFCCQKNHKRDSVFNIAFVVTDVKAMTEKVSKTGKNIIRSVTEINEENGRILYSIVQSECLNVVHTLIEKRNCRHPFLFGFELVELSNPIKNCIEFGINQIDHVTLVCHVGQMENILKWYEKLFGMKRFIMSREEDEQEGMIFDIYDVSMRLKAMQFWKYSETSLTYSPQSYQTDKSFMLVIVEPLTMKNFNHLSTFLLEHEGPGIEHVALHVQTMENSVAKMIQAGAIFRHPPFSYYTQMDKMQQIEKAGKDILTLSDLGILLDYEKDVYFKSTESNERNRFLMQIFSQPIFDKKTFFFEIIQRCGARGFGAGNILALAISIRKESGKNLAKTTEISTNK
ncbi:4-hydroxyphenylpyruvate dioxygenase-like protein isoform X2 [Centruroides sculpturatus]|nr:4-hydroxyphenylpyruvate dioxygenase-like protein isoform X2 [Centruroides sculpturatus]XP_023224785.1 4-hydroxyphenylpyruvate dioxygenase-like protein isoform X2 [Centruroides sculpturatus]XP_023224786.1 4-hydroxyphenylpyruvate dioxygenase-like protein isoform X2 [Centruroides sculpturatus]